MLQGTLKGIDMLVSLSRVLLGVGGASLSSFISAWRKPLLHYSGKNRTGRADTIKYLLFDLLQKCAVS